MKLRPNYVILDAAKMLLEMETAKELTKQHVCLYKGKKATKFGGVAPWLFVYKENGPLAKWLYKNSKKQSWGVYLYTEKPYEELYEHLRKFLLVKTEDNKEKYFRYYDPRVLNVFLPTCEPTQFQDFFGPIKAYFAETKYGDVNMMMPSPMKHNLEDTRLSWLNFFFPRKEKNTLEGN